MRLFTGCQARGKGQTSLPALQDRPSHPNLLPIPAHLSWSGTSVSLLLIPSAAFPQTLLALVIVSLERAASLTPGQLEEALHCLLSPHQDPRQLTTLSRGHWLSLPLPRGKKSRRAVWVLHVNKAEALGWSLPCPVFLPGSIPFPGTGGRAPTNPI